MFMNHSKHTSNTKRKKKMRRMKEEYWMGVLVTTLQMCAHVGVRPGSSECLWRDSLTENDQCNAFAIHILTETASMDEGERGKREKCPWVCVQAFVAHFCIWPCTLMRLNICEWVHCTKASACVHVHSTVYPPVWVCECVFNCHVIY